jgi:hypothetical protein
VSGLGKRTESNLGTAHLADLTTDKETWLIY